MTQPQPNGPPELADEQLTPAEASFYSLVLLGLLSWLAMVRPKVMAPVASGMLPLAEAIFAFMPQWNALVKQWLTALRTQVVPLGTDRLRVELPDMRVPVLPSTDWFIQSYLAQVENYLVRIPDEVYQLVFSEISAGVNEGEEVREIAERVDKILRGTGSENWPNRARLIAITEVNGAANAGWYASAIHTQNELGVRLEKVWIATRDRKVRPSHRHADGQRKALAEPFIVGGWPLLYPGDKNGPPEEVINCRCAAGTKETS